MADLDGNFKSIFNDTCDSSAFKKMQAEFGTSNANASATFSPSTMLGSLNPSLQTKVSATVVSANKATCQSSVKVENGKLNGIKNDIGAVRGDIAQTIRHAQSEAKTAMGDIGASTDMYQNCDSAGLIVGCAIDTATGGGGSVITALLQNVTIDAVSNSKEKFPDQKSAEAAIKSRLLDLSPSQASNNVIAAQGQSGDPAPQPSFDWNKFFDDGHKLKDLMETNPNEPSETLFPEVKALNTLESNIDEVLDHNMAVEAKYDGVAVSLLSGSLRECKVPCKSDFAVATDAIDVVASLNEEFAVAAKINFAPAALNEIRQLV